MSRRAWGILAATAGVVVLAGAAVVGLNLRGEEPIPDGPVAAFSPSTDQIARGAYLARAGNCAGCHTAAGSAAYAGGRAVATPFGAIYATNLTPDAETGLGDWSAAHFWRAMHHGRSRDGRLLYPAFPYTSYTTITRADSDAIFAFLRAQPPVHAPRRPPDLRFPYNTQAALAVWRALFFQPAATAAAAADPARSAEWKRGAYLVQGLGHCAACHGARNALGATTAGHDLEGGLIAVQNWYAPSLHDPAEAGVARWSQEAVVRLLRSGIAPQGTVQGPMADVVAGSTRHLSDADLQAMATYLRALPERPAAAARPVTVAPAVLQRGEAIYGQQCAQCHGDRGEGAAGRFPALAGNRSVTLGDGTNTVQAVLHGGYAPSTPENPRPYGMPPFAQSLDDADVAAVVSFVRTGWGNRGTAVEALDVYRLRGGTP
ncbi:cytochrome c [uncultured Xylophilus sp.]|uniref:cytochrome c n=1 Tax=uncultured Xylophilus sp. TaxID=296832 RepID=UPI0025E63713|nr:cytochrome c [uncultured Xylophilus sp.]